MTLKQAKDAAIKGVRRTGRNQLIIKKADKTYIPFGRGDGTLLTCECLVAALDAAIVDEINVLK